MNAAYQRYMRDGFEKVEGWVVKSVPPVLEALVQASGERGVTGGCCEIGVHHGRLFLAMLGLVGDGHRSLAIDVFEDQALNIDSSGSGSLAAFQKNLKTWSDTGQQVEIMQADSTALSLADIAKIQAEFGKFRLFSVDGGHTPLHAFNDLTIAQQLIANGGIVLLDDFYQPNWPGVTEGFFRFFATGNCKLAPVCISGSKLFLTTISYHKTYFDKLNGILSRTRSDGRRKRNELCGWQVLSFSL